MGSHGVDKDCQDSSEQHSEQFPGGVWRWGKSESFTGLQAMLQLCPLFTDTAFLLLIQLTSLLLVVRVDIDLLLLAVLVVMVVINSLTFIPFRSS